MRVLAYFGRSPKPSLKRNCHDGAFNGGINLDKRKEFSETSGFDVQVIKQERELCKIIRSLDNGEVLLTVREGKPVLVDEIRRKVLLRAEVRHRDNCNIFI